MLMYEEGYEKEVSFGNYFIATLVENSSVKIN